ncbi:MAG: acyltransferase [Clostridium sp.]|nr:acyltransferase [Clostridium sp.]
MKKHFRYIIDTVRSRFCRQFCLNNANVKWITYNLGTPQDNNRVTVENSTVTHTSINITGKNNRVIVRNGAKMFFGGISIEGNDNEVVYDGCKAMINAFVKGNGCKISVGKDALIDESTSIILMGQGNRVEIGEECMFADKVEIWASDTHLITDLHGNPLNPSRPVIIGRHVWLGKGVNVMKGVTIGEHTTVGLGSIVTKDIPAHCIAAGNPAKVMKTGTDWHFGYIKI